jgi:hypothetical protein
MCRPEHLTVSDEIDPWMDVTRPTGTAHTLEIRAAG